MHAAILKQYGEFSYEETAEPVAGEGQVLVRVRFAGICGTDLHIFSGEFHPRTRLPLIPGHEFSGTVEKTGSGVTRFRPGDLVTVDPIIWCGKCAACRTGHYPACSALKLLGVDRDGGFADYVATDQAMVYAIPEGISAAHAALTEVYSIGFHACNRSQVGPGDSVLIYGTGRVGHSILQAVKTKTNGPVFVVDVAGRRLDRARLAHPEVTAINARNDDPVRVIEEATGGRGVDVAFEAVGHPLDVEGRLHPVRACIRSIRGGGSVCVLGLTGEPAPLVMKELIWKEARIVASRVSHGEFSEAIERLSQGKLSPDVLISSVEPLEKIQEAFGNLEHHPEEHLKMLVRM